MISKNRTIFNSTNSVNESTVFTDRNFALGLNQMVVKQNGCKVNMAGVSKEWFGTTDNPYYEEFNIDRIEILLVKDSWPD